MSNLLKLCSLFCISALLPMLALASPDATSPAVDLTTHKLAVLAPVLFAFAYLVVMAEEFIHLRKSKPVVITSGIIWLLVAWICNTQNLPGFAAEAVRHNLLEYVELFMFLLVAMTYVATMEERLVFDSLRSWLVSRGYTFRQLFWITGFIAFFLSPIADNLTTALIMCAVAMAVGGTNTRFISLACINIVVAANAGGAFSPFGDITTLMVWQNEILPFFNFFKIFLPSLVSYLIPAAIMHFAVPNLSPEVSSERVAIKTGGRRVIYLFLITIGLAVSFHSFLHLPPVLGMMTGFGMLQIFSYFLKRTEKNILLPGEQPFDIFKHIKQVEWDTLLFFYGVILSVGGLATLGYLEIVSKTMYTDWGANLSAIHSATPANIMVGIFSAVVDNIPVMFAVLTMNPQMSEGQWLLVTLTAGIGGSLLSVGSAAGVALMGQAQGHYTFFRHLKWTWAIGLGYIAAIFVHLWLNASSF